MTDQPRRARAGGASGRGFSNRVIRAASRTPEVRQRPAGVPIFQSALAARA